MIGDYLEQSCVVLSGPSGVGKTTLVNMAMKSLKRWTQCITCTTRQPREGEVPGKDYHFLQLGDFVNNAFKGEFLEYADVYGHLYGSPLSEIRRARRAKKRMVIILDTVGALSIRAQFPRVPLLGVLPPNMSELLERLNKRGSDSVDQVLRRFVSAYMEIKRMEYYDFIIVNDDLQVATDQLIDILKVYEGEAHVTGPKIYALDDETRGMITRYRQIVKSQFPTLDGSAISGPLVGKSARGKGDRE